MFRKIFQKNEKKSDFRMHVYKGVGYKPFEDLDFNEYEVYKTSNLTVLAHQDRLGLYQKVSLIKGSFTFCVIPSVFEPSKMLEWIQERSQVNKKLKSEEAARYLSLMAEKVPNGSLPETAVYAVIKKNDCFYVKAELAKLGFTLSEIEPKKAKMIAVTYLE